MKFSGNKEAVPVRAPEYMTNEPADDHSTNLANIVAKARKDLEKGDEK